jgi:hypothetical protein
MPWRGRAGPGGAGRGRPGADWKPPGPERLTATSTGNVQTAKMWFACFVLGVRPTTLRRTTSRGGWNHKVWSRDPRDMVMTTFRGVRNHKVWSRDPRDMVMTILRTVANHNMWFRRPHYVVTITSRSGTQSVVSVELYPKIQNTCRRAASTVSQDHEMWPRVAEPHFMGLIHGASGQPLYS